MLKATPKSEWTMLAAGCVICFPPAAAIGRFTAHDTLKDLAAHILTFTRENCGTTRLLILRIKSCAFSADKKGPAILVLCDNEKFVKQCSPSGDEIDRCPDFPLNKLVPLTTENLDKLQAWTDHIRTYVSKHPQDLRELQ